MQNDDSHLSIYINYIRALFNKLQMYSQNVQKQKLKIL